MNVEVTVTITAPDGTSHSHDVASFNKGYENSADIGLSIAESKALLLRLQKKIIDAQVEAFCATRSNCPHCGRLLRRKGSRQIRYRTVFGDIPISSPRFYHCACKARSSKTFSPLTDLLPEHVSPEMLWLETKWASLASYGMSVDLLKDVLPVGDKLNAETVRRHVGQIAERLEAELGEEQGTFIETSAFERARLPNPAGPIVVGLDGGYVRSRMAGQSHFEVTVGKSMATSGGNRYIGLVQSHDEKPKRRLNSILKEQGFQENQHITFMTDGGETVLSIARYMAPASEHILDWFHITMRVTVMQQYVKGLAHHNPADAEEMSRLLRQIKGFLWNGNTYDGLRAIDDLVVDLDIVEADYESIKALRKAATDFYTYINNCADIIPNYAERRRYGERVSTGFVESTVNTVVGKRFCKRQQMRWSKQGAHDMLQIRTRTLDGTLRAKFEQWHPSMKTHQETAMAA